MGFLYNEAKRVAATPKKPSTPRGHIPIESLNRMGCAVCPSDKDTRLKSPKMAARGASNSHVYLLGSAPGEIEDDRGELFVDQGGRAVLSKFTREFLDEHVRIGHMVQCMPPNVSLEVKQIECCRGRVVADIEANKPTIVVGVGDEVLHWATGLPRSGLTFRGSLIATKFGNHWAWFFPVLYPNYIKSKRRSGTNEYELTLEHDLAYVEQLIEVGIRPPLTGVDEPPHAGVEIITGQEQGDMRRLEEALHWAIALPAGGFDIESTGLRPMMHDNPRILTAAVGTFKRSIAFAVDHPDGWGTDIRMHKVRGMLGDYVLQSGRKRCHNLQMEQEWCRFMFGEYVLRRTEWDDTMAMAYVFDSRPKTKSLDVQGRMRFGFFLKALSRIDLSRPNWWLEYPLKETLLYNGADAKWTDLLADVQLERLSHEPELRDVYERRVRLAPTLVLMTAKGMPLDEPHAKTLASGILDKMNVIEDKARRLAQVRAYSAKHGTFSLTNPDHVLKLLKDLKRPEIEVTDRDGTVKYSTSEDVLALIPAAEAPVAQLVLDHRGLAKLESTYLRPVIEGRGITRGRLHYEYKSMDTVTGRLSSDAHNWPKHKHKEVRGVVAAAPGEWMVACDYGQLQFRIAGMYSQDPNIIKACWTGYDVHGFWAQRTYEIYPAIVDSIVAEFGVDWDKAGMKTLRQTIKNGWVFPLLFGATWEGCAGRIHVPMDVAEGMAGEFWSEFGEHLKWQEQVIKFYERNLFVETLGGFRRRGPTSRNELINLGIQGTESEIVCAAMNAISERAEEDELPDLQFAFHGHDDLSFFISDDRLESHIDIITHEMCKPRFDYINVPMIVEVSVGARWNELKEIGKYSSADLFGLQSPYK